jgi:hypothetical protein
VKVGDWVATSKGITGVIGFINDMDEVNGRVEVYITQPEDKRGVKVWKHFSYCKNKAADMTPDDYHDMYSVLVDLPLATHDKPYFMELCQESQYMQGSRW